MNKEEVEITIKMKTGKMFMRMGWANIRNDEGNVVGGMTAGAIEVEVEGKSYSIEPKDLWDAVVKKLGRNDLAFEK